MEGLTDAIKTTASKVSARVKTEPDRLLGIIVETYVYHHHHHHRSMTDLPAKVSVYAALVSQINKECPEFVDKMLREFERVSFEYFKAFDCQKMRCLVWLHAPSPSWYRCVRTVS